MGDAFGIASPGIISTANDCTAESAVTGGPEMHHSAAAHGCVAESAVTGGPAMLNHAANVPAVSPAGLRA